MKIDWNSKYTTIAVYVLIVSFALVLGIFLIANLAAVMQWLSAIFKPLNYILMGFFIAYLLNPLLRFYENTVLKKLVKKASGRTKRTVALLLCYITTLFLLITFGWIVIPEIGSSITSLATQFPSYSENVQKLTGEWLGKMSESSLYFLFEGIIDFVYSLESLIYSFVLELAPQVMNFVMNLTSAIFTFFVGTVFSLYLLASKEKFSAQINKFANAVLPKKTVGFLARHLKDAHTTFGGFFTGKTLESAIMFIICLVFMSIMRMPYPMLVSVIVAVTNIIPYVGPFIGAIPSMLFIFLASPFDALLFGIFILVLQQIDGNFIGPKIIGDTTGVTPFWVLFSIIFFGGLFGALGMFLGVPLFSVFYSIAKEIIHIRLKKKGLPTETALYAASEHPVLSGKQNKKGLFSSITGVFKE